MPAISENQQKTTPRFTGYAKYATLVLALLLFGIFCYLLAGSDASTVQEACIAAHAAEQGIDRQQLSSEARHQSALVAILSSCTGMAP
ncbi:hypothetical protein LT85_0131 [Collimonas arenae]|uniref:Uncharacterized protein n=1 Tax=Collimonas arenae TaxID=279058 RepID=A0A0A1F453_9BURK|nr:hypothetical protein [Collimonas arenae]AIY39291.1 hypothetical protein LT85_0131 [Collimonas arenae]